MKRERRQLGKGRRRKREEGKRKEGGKRGPGKKMGVDKEGNELPEELNIEGVREAGRRRKKDIELPEELKTGEK